MSEFQKYLDGLGHWPKSRFYARADVKSTYFWKLKNGQKFASAELIRRVWLATEGEVDLDSVLEWFLERRMAQTKEEILSLERYWSRVEDS